MELHLVDDSVTRIGLQLGPPIDGVHGGFSTTSSSSSSSSAASGYRTLTWSGSPIIVIHQISLRYKFVTKIPTPIWIIKSLNLDKHEHRFWDRKFQRFCCGWDYHESVLRRRSGQGKGEDFNNLERERIICKNIWERNISYIEVILRIESIRILCNELSFVFFSFSVFWVNRNDLVWHRSVFYNKIYYNTRAMVCLAGERNKGQ